jgi:hypothetical protein
LSPPVKLVATPENVLRQSRLEANASDVPNAQSLSTTPSVVLDGGAAPGLATTPDAQVGHDMRTTMSLLA